MFKPIAYIRGDETVRRVGDLIRTYLLSDIPLIIIDASVEEREKTNDQVIVDAADAIKECNAGFKESTASAKSKQINDKRESMNIVLRPMCGAYSMERLLMLPSKYRSVCGVFRYGSGGIYDILDKNEHFPTHNIEYGTYPIGHPCFGEEYIIEPVITNLTGMTYAAEKAANIAKTYGLKLFVSSKWTIAKSEAELVERVSKKWRDMGVEYITDEKAQEHKAGSFVRRLTDIMMANLPLSRMSEGGFLVFMPNAPGDSGSDVVDICDGSRSMTSIVHCRNGLAYEELPGGTAPDLLETDLRGENFFNPLASILGIANMIEFVNPQLQGWCSTVRNAAIEYLHITNAIDRCTEAMIRYVAEKAGKAAA